MNLAILKGRLGQDPELKYTSAGDAVCNVSIATNKRWKNKKGESQEKTEWHRLVIWGPKAEAFNQYMSKGRETIVEGEIQTRSWEDKEGNKKYTTEIVVNNFEFCGSNGEASEKPKANTTFEDDDIPF